MREQARVDAGTLELVVFSVTALLHELRGMSHYLQMKSICDREACSATLSEQGLGSSESSEHDFVYGVTKRAGPYSRRFYRALNDRKFRAIRHCPLH